MPLLFDSPLKTLVAGTGILYCGALIYGILNPHLVPSYNSTNDFLLEHNYGAECDFSWDNVMGRMDVFVASHFIGWFVQIFLWRDFWFVSFLSIQFELVELSLAHWLPNFIECWWDSLLFDTLGWNLFGSILGYLVYFKLMGGKPMDWFGLTRSKDSWAKDFAVVAPAILCNNLGQTTGFFLKKMFLLPSNHPLFALHLALIGVISMYSAPDYYNYVHANKKTTSNLIFPTLIVVTLILETIFISMTGGPIFDVSTPSWVFPFWMSLSSLLAGALYAKSRSAIWILTLLTLICTIFGTVRYTAKS